ncbi:5-oxoprolinase subunit PxpA [Phnomibacter sp. MR]|uniref:5-oxoprolinase subunit PxpA n=1 Tax=Phnomibacter sp. MR TaxID=3042318 RepID=UPI003A810D24
MQPIIDVNADVGEGMLTDAALIPLISSANIACSYHAGDAATIATTIDLCKQQGVAIGAHPGFADKANFGRNDMMLPTPDAWYQLIAEQLSIIEEACNKAGVSMRHVKPHGALYNMSARMPEIAHIIAQAVYDFNPNLLLYGLAGSHSISAAKAIGLTTVDEFFADRTYQPDGSLTPRTQSNALITDDEVAMQQALNIAMHGKIMAADGSMIHPAAGVSKSICLHGDGAHAISFAQHIVHAFQQNGINIQAHG